MRRGNCYVTCEALYHLLGGKKVGWVPCVVKVNGQTHWYLESRMWDGSVWLRLDPTAKQFKDPVDYSKGRGCGFLTKAPSKKARKLMNKMLWGDK